MAVFEKWFKQDLLEPIKIHSVGDLVFTEDNLSNVVGVELFRGGNKAIISGSVNCYAIRSDGRTVPITNGTISENKISVTLPKAAMMVPGKVGVMIQLETGEIKTTVLKVVFFSTLELTGTIVDPEHIVPDISDIISQMAAMEAATTAAQNAADELNNNMADIIKAQATQPIELINKVWFDTSSDVEVTVPEVKNAVISPSDTWSSSKIAEMLSVNRASGNVAKFEDGAGGIPIKSMVMNLDPVQSGSGDPSSENVREFQAISEFDYIITGKNLCTSQPYIVETSGAQDPLVVAIPQRYFPNGARVVLYVRDLTFENASAVLGAIARKSDWSYLYKTGDLVTLNGFKKADGTSMTKNQEPYTGLAYINLDHNEPITFRNFRLYSNKVGWNRWVGSIDWCMVVDSHELPNEYIPFAGIQRQTVTITGAGSFYGGFAEYSSDGVLTIKAYPFYDSYDGETLVGPWLSSEDVYAEGATPTTGAQVIDLGGATTVYSTVATGGLCTVDGENQIWTDAGDISVEYYSEIVSRNEYLGLSGDVDELGSDFSALRDNLPDYSRPVLVNGSPANPSSGNSISTQYIIPIDFTKDKVTVEFVGDLSLADAYGWGYCKYHGATDGMTAREAYTDTNVTTMQYNNNVSLLKSKPIITVKTSGLVGYEHIAFFLVRKNGSEYVPLRIATDQYSFKMVWENVGTPSAREVDFEETKQELLYAKHRPANIGTRLTLVHFSDTHGDKEALMRIMADARELEYDDAICTGDMVPGTRYPIESWWDKSVMTCIGNHDTATYDSQTGYDWTNLSMADRDAYYIAPFEENWNVVHTSGTSYYYKDYPDAAVRMIVMDCMLYYGEDGAEALAQTTWLSDLLADAITESLHVLIAIHTPHNGSSALRCSFSRYNQANRTGTDVSTPQVVIDAVATAINNGLNFIGYLVGHTHQDNIWDAESDGTQLMYCVTCAAVSAADQWKNSDQYRDEENDAYNIVVIDTAKTLIKVIRGGGANIDDHMRKRKAICVDYSTGTVTGEVL